MIGMLFSIFFSMIGFLLILWFATWFITYIVFGIVYGSWVIIRWTDDVHNAFVQIGDRLYNQYSRRKDKS
jgi:hypothetical protein